MNPIHNIANISLKHVPSYATHSPFFSKQTLQIIQTAQIVQQLSILTAISPSHVLPSSFGESVCIAILLSPCNLHPYMHGSIGNSHVYFSFPSISPDMPWLHCTNSDMHHTFSHENLTSKHHIFQKKCVI